MNDINVIKPVKENDKKGIWDKIKNTSAVIAAVAIMTTVSCSSKSEIEWTGDKDNVQNDELVEDVDELLNDEETDEEVDEEQDEDLIDVDMDIEIDDELLVDEDSIDVDMDIEIDDELVIDEDEEQDLDTVPDEDTIVEIPETIVHMKFLVGDTLIESDAGEIIEVNGMEYTVKYDNNDGSIYLMNGQEINRIEWQNSKIVNGVEVSLNDMYVDQTKFESRALVNVTINEKTFNVIITEESHGISAQLVNDQFEYVFLDIEKIYPWDYSGTEVIIKEFESQIDGVKTNASNIKLKENVSENVSSFVLNSQYSVDLYNGTNTLAILEITMGEETQAVSFVENQNKTVNINGTDVTIEVDKMYFDEINMKGWANVFVNGEIVRTFEQDIIENYNEIKIELKQVKFIVE